MSKALDFVSITRIDRDVFLTRKKEQKLLSLHQSSVQELASENRNKSIIGSREKNVLKKYCLIITAVIKRNSHRT